MKSISIVASWKHFSILGVAEKSKSHIGHLHMQVLTMAHLHKKHENTWHSFGSPLEIHPVFSCYAVCLCPLQLARWETLWNLRKEWLASGYWRVIRRLFALADIESYVFFRYFLHSCSADSGDIYPVCTVSQHWISSHQSCHQYSRHFPSPGYGRVELRPEEPCETESG